MAARLYVGLVPWLVFCMIDRLHGLGMGWAALLATLTSLLVVASCLLRRPLQRPTGLEAGSLALFSALWVFGFIHGVEWEHLRLYGRAVAAGALALLLLGSLVRTPVVDTAAQHAVPSRFRAQSAYRATAVAITATWGIAASCIAVAFLIGAPMQSAGATTLLNWCVPLVAVIGAIAVTRRLWAAFEELMHDELSDSPDDDVRTLGLVLQPRPPRRLRLVQSATRSEVVEAGAAEAPRNVL